MGSYPDTVNLLKYVRSKSQVDCDSVDIQLVKDLGPFADVTSNQADTYLELVLPQRAAILKDAATASRQWLHEFPDVTYEKLAVEIGMIKLSLSVEPFITGSLHVMSDPTLTTTSQVVANAQRMANLCQRISPSFDQSRLCIKVASTWEGLQACRKLSGLGIRTLATTLFTIEQAALAAEAGCASISPFVHELKAFFDESYDDGGPNLELCVQAQNYYAKHSFPTRVKAAGLLTAMEAKKLAGLDAMTIAPDLLHTLVETEEDKADVVGTSLVMNKSMAEIGLDRKYYIDDEQGYRKAFAKGYDGKGSWKTDEAIEIFKQYQHKAEALMKENDPTLDIKAGAE